MSASFSVERMRRQLARNTEAAETANRHRWLDSLSPEHRARHERQRLGEICLECVTVNLSTFNGRMMSVADIMQTKAGPR